MFFDFPKRIFLTSECGDKVSNFYRQVFQDILDYGGQGHTIEDSIVRRVRSEEKTVSWVDFLGIFSKSYDKAKIQHVMDRASRAVFDEPASDLHAAAQQRLIESFPAIAQDNHTLIYTTHSHYMIEPNLKSSMLTRKRKTWQNFP